MKALKKIMILVTIAGIISLMVCSIFFLTQVIYVEKHPINIEAKNKNILATSIYDKDGKLVQKLGSNMAKSNYTSEIPETVKKAVVSIEDKRFYEHNGIDVRRTGSAILSYITNLGDSDYGGSTITQQLVKNVSGENEKTITRKVREWIYAIDIENKYEKEDIITEYLNIVYFGNGIYGIKDAAGYYFNKEIIDLSLNEIAYLAGIIQMPETYIKDSKLGNERKNTVLYCMYNQGYISEQEYSTNIKKDISVSIIGRNQEIQSYFVDSIIVKLSEVIAEKYNISNDEATSKIYQGGYKIYSTIDTQVQNEIDVIYDNLSEIQSSIVIMSNEGKVVALRGGTGVKTADMVLNRALSSRRQPGSAFKPIAVYAPALEKKMITYDTILCDKSVTYGEWSPTNWYSGFRGNISVRKALEISCNTVAVQVLEKTGINNSLDFLSKMNFKLDKNDNNLSLALGGLTYGTTTLEMASGYQTLANKGVYCEPIFFTIVIDKNGNEVYNYKKEQEVKRVFSEETSNNITNLLTSVVKGTEGTARSFNLQNSEVVAKTGTSDNTKDKWLCAYTPHYTVATWYGYDNPRTINYSSTQIQKTTKSIFDKIHLNVDNKVFDLQNKTSEKTICSNTNLLATEFCKNTIKKEVEDNNLKLCDQCKKEVEEIKTEQKEDIVTHKPEREIQEDRQNEGAEVDEGTVSDEIKTDDTQGKAETEEGETINPPENKEEIFLTQE